MKLIIDITQAEMDKDKKLAYADKLIKLLRKLMSKE